MEQKYPSFMGPDLWCSVAVTQFITCKANKIYKHIICILHVHAFVHNLLQMHSWRNTNFLGFFYSIGDFWVAVCFLIYNVRICSCFHTSFGI